MQAWILFGIVASTYLMVVAKRVPVLIRSFRYQSVLLFVFTLSVAWQENHAQLYGMAAFILALKVVYIPYALRRIAGKIKVDENLGLFVNVQLSLLAALALTFCSRIFANALGFRQDFAAVAVTVALAVVFIGAFLMVARMKAFTQVIGLLVMENGIFLLGTALSGGMPFFVEIAVSLDVLVSVIIMGLFVYRINRLFTHIDVNKLSRLRG